MGSVVSKPPPPSQKAGTGQLGSHKSSTPTLPSSSNMPQWLYNVLYPISNFFITYLIAPIHYWTFFQGCGPFGLGGCKYMYLNQWEVLYAQSKENYYPACPTPGWLKFFWVMADIIGFALLVVILILGGFLLQEFSFIPQFIYDVFSLLEGLLSPLISIFGSILGWVFTYFESAATYVLQFFGFAGDLAGQSVFGIFTDVASSFAQMSGVPTLLWYILFGEGITYALLKLVEQYGGGSATNNWNCLKKKLYKTLDWPFYMLTTSVFPGGFFHYFLGALFLPVRVVIYITTILVGTVWCDIFDDASCSQYGTQCDVPPPPPVKSK